MAVDLLVRLVGPMALASGTSTIFAGVAGHTYTIRDITIVNTARSSVTVSLGIGGLGNSKLILPPAAIDSNGMATFSGVQILHETEPLMASASATGLSITVNGMDQLL